MLVVPLEKDVIVTKDDLTYTVVEYTNFKEAGPAVYVRQGSAKELDLVYFVDIATINGTEVEYKKGSRVFFALGKVTRTIHLPQPDDKISVDGTTFVEVKDLKLKSKSLGQSRGMFVKDIDGDAYRIIDIVDIKRSLGSDSFDRDLFQKIYKDYIGVKK